MKIYIHFEQEPGKSDIVFFCNMASYIVRRFQSTEASKTSEEIVKAAAHQIFKSDIRAMEESKTYHPSIKNMKSIIDFHKSDVSLQTLLKNIFSSELKQISYSQSIISSILFGIGVDMDRYFASTWLVNPPIEVGVFSFSR